MEVATYTANIFMAGDLATAAAVLRRECYEKGLCVTLTPTTFIYTAGEEAGFVVGLVNYPRFPEEPHDIRHRATLIAHRLMLACCQRSALLVTPDVTDWLTTTVPGARE